MRILLIGPRYRKDRRSVGGIVVLFEDLVHYCKEQRVECRIIDTNKANYRNIFIAYLSVLYQITRQAARSSVVLLNGTYKDYLYIGPVVRFAGKIYGRPYVLRKFAGDFHHRYEQSSRMRRFVLKGLLRHAAITFWETRSLTEWGIRFNGQSLWFPNSRLRPAISAHTPKKYRKRFVFISQVSKEKGIDILLGAFRLLDDTYRLDIYGPLKGYEYSELGEYYKGIIPPEKIYETLAGYDYLILPSLREGYPGIIIESFAVGVPPIATSVGGIPEMIRDRVNGRLVVTQTPQALAETIRGISEKDFLYESHNARSSFELYDSEKVYARIMNAIKELSRNHKSGVDCP